MNKNILIPVVAATVVMAGGAFALSQHHDQSPMFGGTAAGDTVVDNAASATTVAIVKDGEVINVVTVPVGWTGSRKGDWTPPEGTTAVPSAIAAPGDSYANGKVTKHAAKTTATPTLDELKAKGSFTPEEQQAALKLLLEKQAP